MTIRLVHLFTGTDGESHFTEGPMTTHPLGEDSSGSQPQEVGTISFTETAPGSSRSWHNAPHRQWVITLSGTLEFETLPGETFTIVSGDVLLAEDTTGGGHRWRLLDGEPWRRVYVTR